MTISKVELGAPSLTGRVAELIAKVFSGCDYPVKVKVKNRMPHDITLSEVRGLYLRGVAVSDGSNEKTVLVDSLDQLIRMASSVQQIAVLNGHQYVVMTLERVDAQGVERALFIKPNDPIVQPGLDKEPEKEPEPEQEPEPEHDQKNVSNEQDENNKKVDDEAETEKQKASEPAPTLNPHKKAAHKKAAKSQANGG
ncbi:MAG: hypothetical protein K2Q13_10170 [Nitrosomonas sp.]|uniref:hypothetical protein n=1 Tax=Nitrosomonas sp. TaxID=42353 RepID=UPI0025DF4606|nr:hypothetical protein [Nitrosomonas sp.]MBY0475407.1 hypothetical protein [Nitrosomonas sp.]